MRKVRQRVEIAASGGYLKGSGSKRVVKWDPDGRNVHPGPGVIATIAFIIIIVIILIIFHLFGTRCQSLRN